jgi:hypothetical protein
MTRQEVIAGIGVVLIVSGLVLRFFGSSIVLPALGLVCSLSEETVTRLLQAVGLLEIVAGIGLLALVAARVRSRSASSSDTETG